MAAPTRLNTAEFERTRREYMKFTRRDTATVINTKLFYIARRATVETPKANKASMVQELKGKRMKAVKLKSGRIKNVKSTLAELIIWGRRLKSGGSTKKKDMREEVKKLIAARLRSIAFIKSGWIPAIKRLESLAERIGGAAARPDRSAKQIGKPKGSAKPAREGVRPIGSITNDALPKGRKGLLNRIFGGKRNEVLAIATPALQRAFDFEVRSMKDYIARKLAARAQRLGIKARAT